MVRSGSVGAWCLRGASVSQAPWEGGACPVLPRDTRSPRNPPFSHSPGLPLPAALKNASCGPGHSQASAGGRALGSQEGLDKKPGVLRSQAWGTQIQEAAGGRGGWGGWARLWQTLEAGGKYQAWSGMGAGALRPVGRVPRRVAQGTQGVGSPAWTATPNSGAGVRPTRTPAAVFSLSNAGIWLRTQRKRYF